jgi:tight adherence protein B
VTDQPATWLVYAGSCALCAGLLGLGVHLWYHPQLRRRIARHEATLEERLRYLQRPLSARRLLSWQIGLVLASVAIALLAGTCFVLAAGLAACFVPGAMLTRATRVRTQRVEEQLDTWLIALANALHASSALGDALAHSQRLVAAPLADELARVLREHELGVPLDRALEDLGKRVASPVVSTGLATLRIARNTGGDLAATLKSAASSLRELARLEGVVRTKTAEGRAQAFVIAAVPVPLVWMLDALDPTLLAPLWSTTTGHFVVAAALLLWGAALLLARKILAVDV